MALPWYVAHTRPRAEKKLADFCRTADCPTELPLYSSVKVYRGKRLVFHKPLFPGYLFVRLTPEQTTQVRQHQHVANLLVPFDQEEFASQLSAVLVALSEKREVRIAPEIVAGRTVRLTRGPLTGVEGVVVHRAGIVEVVLRLDFIGQGAAMRVAADEIELV